MNKIGLAFLVLLLVGGGIFFLSAMKVPNSAADNALIQAAHENNLENVKKALADGANPNAAQNKSKWEEWFGEKTFEEGNTPLIYAAQAGNIEMINLLLEKGAKVNQQSDDGVTALMMAAHHLRKDCVKLLLDKGADVTLKSKQGSSAKDAATKRNATPESREMEQMIADALRKKGVDVRVTPGGIPQ